jgi:hypothetical protein
LNHQDESLRKSVKLGTNAKQDEDLDPQWEAKKSREGKNVF